MKEPRSDVIAAVRALVDAVFVEHCTDCIEGELNEEHTLNCALTVLRKILATPELSSLHPWAQKLLDAHAADCEDLWTRFYSEHGYDWWKKLGRPDEENR